MKILYLSGGQGVDYLCDLVFHGLRSLHGADVVDLNPLWWMYEDAPVEQTSQLYGRGFTVSRTLPKLEIDRTDIEQKIKARYFDLIVFGSIQREFMALGGVIQSGYKRNQVIFIDGEDGPNFLGDCVKHGLYFKREMYSPQPGLYPIQFSIPASKIKEPFTIGSRMHFTAPLDPMMRTTYIYNDEESYYTMYRRSQFAMTMKKAGWDCLRHYEIMAAGCVPIFRDLQHCPDSIMTELPKKELLVAKSIYEYDSARLFHTSAGESIWQDLLQSIHETLVKRLTTVALAERILEIQFANSDQPMYSLR